MAVTGNTHGFAHPHQQAQQAPRFDIYARIHKALRAFMADTLLRVGRTDTDDEAELRGTLSQVRDLLSACEQHLHKENDYVHAAMEARVPGSTARIAHEHVTHMTEIRALLALAERVAATVPAARADAIRELYRQLSLFVAENYEHMHFEETRHNAVLWASHTDAELLDVENRIVASLPQETVGVIARWMLPNVTPAERALMLAGIRDHAPAEAFTGLLDVCRTLLPMPDWMKLTRALGLPSGPTQAAWAAG